MSYDPGMVFTPYTPSRALNVPFTPNPDKATLVFYTFSIACSSTLIGPQSGAVELRCDTTLVPTTFCARTSHTMSGVLATSTVETELSYLVPPNSSVVLVSSGAATIGFTGQREVTMG